MLDLALLGLLADGPLHGYELQKRLAALPGVGGVSFGSLYPALRRLARAGYITSVAEPAAPVTDTPVPMTGSLGGEVAAHRARRGARRTPRRARKVHALTEAGRAHLRRLVVGDADNDTDDDRTVALRLAFCGILTAPERAHLLAARRRVLTDRLEALERALTDETDPWRRRLLAREQALVTADLTWLDDTTAATADVVTPTTPGGTP